MNVLKLNLKMSAIALIFFTNIISVIAQGSSVKNKFPEFASYKTFGWNFSPLLYRAANFDTTIGTIQIEGKATPSITFGFTKVIHPEREFNFRYGLLFNLLPLEHYTINIGDGEVPGFTGDATTFKTYGTFLFSIPLQIELKKQLERNLYFSMMAGVNITLLRPGSVTSSKSYYIEELDQIRQVFALQALTRETSIYPNLILSPGLYYLTNRILIQTSIIYQKAIPNYFTGEYLQDNLEISERAEGQYSLSGDYIGLSFNFFFKKKDVKSKKKLKEKAVKNIYIN